MLREAARDLPGLDVVGRDTAMGVACGNAFDAWNAPGGTWMWTPGEAARSELEASQPEWIGRISPVSSDNLRAVLGRHYPQADIAPLKLALVGYNLKFARPIIEFLARIPGLDVRVDEWPRFAVHDPDATAAAVAWADVVWCEWAGPNAAFVAPLLTSKQRAIVRLHRFELERPEINDVDADAFERIIAVGPHYAERISAELGWERARIVVIPNLVDPLALSRPKLPEARFRVGMLGASSKRKRLDLALDIVEGLRQEDERFELRVKSERPHNAKWVWDNDAERRYFGLLEGRLAEVQWEAGGPDVGRWLQGIGHVLSASDDESFHLAPAEGMASGAVPVVRPWPGARELYGEWVTDTPEATILAGSDPDRWNDARRRAHTQALEAFGHDAVVAQWLDLISVAP